MRGKPIAVNSGLTVRHDTEGSGEDCLVLSGSGLSGPLYLGTTSLHTIFQHMGREAVLRLLGEPELPVGRPPAPGTKGWADKMRAMEPLSTHVWGMADQQFVHKRHIKALERGFRQLEDTVVHNPDSVLHRLQKTEGLLGQALGRIEKLEAELTGVRVRIDRIVIGFTDHDHLLSERIKELDEKLTRKIKAVLHRRRVVWGGSIADG